MDTRVLARFGGSLFQASNHSPGIAFEPFTTFQFSNSLRTRVSASIHESARRPDSVRFVELVNTMAD